MRILKLLVLGASSLLAGNAYCSDTEPVERAQTIHDKIRPDYVNEWWQWAHSMPQVVSPVKDRTGKRCGVNQEGPVWFLAGGYGSSKISRTCSIPAGKHIFFPVINMIYYPQDGDNTPTCDAMKQNASLNNQFLTSFKVVVDGHEYVNPAYFRVGSKHCFDLLGKIPREHNPPIVYPAASDGYWVMLKPFSPSTHKIWFTAQYNRQDGAYGTVIQDIEYEIEIVSP